MNYVAEAGQALVSTWLPNASHCSFPWAELTPQSLAFISFAALFSAAGPPKYLNQYAQNLKHRSLTILMQASL